MYQMRVCTNHIMHGCALALLAMYYYPLRYIIVKEKGREEKGGGLMRMDELVDGERSGWFPI